MRHNWRLATGWYGKSLGNYCGNGNEVANRGGSLLVGSISSPRARRGKGMASRKTVGVMQSAEV